MSGPYDVFFSYHPADLPAVIEIARRLHDIGLKPFVDRWDLVPGELRLPKIREAIEVSKTVACVLGSNPITPGQEEERCLALGLAAREHDRRIIPVLLKGARIEDLGMLQTRTPVDLTDDDWFTCLVAGIKGHAPGDPRRRTDDPYKP